MVHGNPIHCQGNHGEPHQIIDATKSSSHTFQPQCFSHLVSTPYKQGNTHTELLFSSRPYTQFCDNVNQTFNEARKQLDVVAQDIQRDTQDNERLQRANECLQNDNERLQRRNESLQHDNRRLDSAVDLLEGRLAYANIHIKQLRSEKKRLFKELRLFRENQDLVKVAGYVSSQSKPSSLPVLCQLMQMHLDLYPNYSRDQECSDVQGPVAENKKNLQSDQRRLHQLEKSQSNPNHPYCHFSTGNFEVLKTGPESKGIDVRQKFIDFHAKHYSANRMKLCVLGREPLDVLQSWVADLFSGVPNKNLAPNRWDDESRIAVLLARVDGYVVDFDVVEQLRARTQTPQTPSR
ncbi:Uu.00g137460.m01.CDS01 [Anthostomella pinea]|uniref:Uu.00g137460.m01.CDS01 n=1 Tax=Anthostomella pinea TaxID=933095 RepID=A0AAI8YL85_9PEZI|nr:Uu.00g137460.m01.CDS01 [Anthostomella pinea]